MFVYKKYIIISRTWKLTAIAIIQIISKLKLTPNYVATNCYKEKHKACCPSSINLVSFDFPRWASSTKLRVVPTKVFAFEPTVQLLFRLWIK